MFVCGSPKSVHIIDIGVAPAAAILGMQDSSSVQVSRRKKAHIVIVIDNSSFKPH